MSVMLAPESGGGSALLAAAHWIEALVQGPAATTVAVLAIASTGLLMMTGRLPIRRGLVVTLGCFVLFGAPAIARGIMGSASAIADQEPSAPIAPAAFEAPKFEPPPPHRPPSGDPYAGASLAN